MKTALIGKGYWGSILKRYIKGSEFFELVSVCDSKSDLNTVWSNKEIEAVVVATPIDTHYEIVRQALLAGKHVFSEKPLTLKGKEARELREIAKKQKKVLHTEYVFTFSNLLHRAKSLIDAGNVGELQAIEMCVKHLGRFGRQNVYWLLASHMLSVLDMFCPLELLDFCFVDLIKDETGTIFFDGEIRGKIDVSLNYAWKDVKVVLYCEKATILYSPQDNSLETVYYEKPVWVTKDKIPQRHNLIMFDEGNNLQYAFESFRDCILGKEVSNVNLAVKISEVLEKR